LNDSTRKSTPQLADVERAKYLWEEYRYRHDLIWRLLFRMTAVAVLLSIAPFTIDDLVKETAGAWVNALPALALALVAISWIVLLFELKLFNPIDRAYTAAQEQAIGGRGAQEDPGRFCLGHPPLPGRSVRPAPRRRLRRLVARLAFRRVPSSDCCAGRHPVLGLAVGTRLG
jgi:hypothetical protein